MNHTDKTHWAEDEDLLDRYVLDRVDAAERRALEDHLRKCESCLGKVRAEQRIVTGVRQLGRDRLKQRLRKQLDVEEHQHAPWPRIATLAAVLFILVGVGMYNEWFKLHFGDDATIQETLRQDFEGTDSRVQTHRDLNSLGGEQTDNERKELQTAQALSDEPPEAKAAEVARGDLPEVQRETLKKTEQTLVERSHPGAGAAVKEAAQLMQEHASIEGVADEMHSGWVGGRVLTPQPEAAAAPRKADKRDELTRLDKGRPSLLKQKADEKISRTIRGLTINLNQLPASSLPRSQMHLQASNTIPTRVEQTGNTISLTLYLQEPFTSEQFHAARLESPASDSLLVFLPGLQIGYQLSSLKIRE